MTADGFRFTNVCGYGPWPSWGRREYAAFADSKVNQHLLHAVFAPRGLVCAAKTEPICPVGRITGPANARSPCRFTSSISYYIV